MKDLHPSNGKSIHLKPLRCRGIREKKKQPEPVSLWGTDACLVIQMVAALEVWMGKWMRIQVQWASQERINSNPPAFGGADVVGKSLQLCIQKQKNMPVSYKHNDERQVHWSVHIYLAMQCFFLCKYFGSFRCNASFKTVHCSKNKETLN